MEIDAESAAHERAPLRDPPPHVRVARGELGAKRLIGERDAILDVGREVVRAGRRNDVDLERHARAQLDLGVRARRVN